jgi:protein-serine/threonine kinase
VGIGLIITHVRIPGQLYVVNGLPSSIYSTTNTLLPSVSAPIRKMNTSVSPLLSGASTPNLIANFNPFDGTASELGTPISPLVNPFASPSLGPELPAVPKPKKTAPLQIKKRSKGPSTELVVTPLKDNVGTNAATLPFRVIKPSLPTLEKAMSIALFFEQYYHALLKPLTTAPAHPGNYVLARSRRLQQLEASFLLDRYMSEGEKETKREELVKEENRLLRERRQKIDIKGFEMGRVIGHGAFGVVRIARERQSGRLVAMKQVSLCLLALTKVTESRVG